MTVEDICLCLSPVTLSRFCFRSVSEFSSNQSRACCSAQVCAQPLHRARYELADGDRWARRIAQRRRRAGPQTRGNLRLRGRPFVRTSGDIGEALVSIIRRGAAHALRRQRDRRLRRERLGGALLRFGLCFGLGANGLLLSAPRGG